MSELRVEHYRSELAPAWSKLLAGSKNGTFLFERDYCEYHRDRFQDASLVVFEGNAPLALFPASRHGDEVRSHGGLTYGGLVTDARIGVAQSLEVFDALVRQWQADGVAQVLYKAVPHIYHAMPAEEDLYALFRLGARLVRRDAATTLHQTVRAPMSGNRRRGIAKGRASGVSVERSYDWDAFMEVETTRLQEKHGARPVHTADELRRLAERFPDNIQLWVGHVDGALAAGTVVYVTPWVAHTQYIGTTERGREVFALDVVVDQLLAGPYADRRWFDFGISTERDGTVLNAGLAFNKERWGARTITYDHYRIDVLAAAARERA